MSRKDKLLTVAIIIAIFFSACSSSDYSQFYSENYTECIYTKTSYDENSYDDVTVYKMNNIFKADYGLDLLVDHDLLWSGPENTAIIRFYFPVEAKRWQLDSARSYALNELNLLNINSYEYNPYGLWIMENLIETETIIISEVYGDGDLLIQDTYTNRVEVRRFENTTPVIDARFMDSEWTKALDEYIKSEVTTNKIVYQNSLLGYSMIVQIESEKNVNPTKLANIMKYIETEAPKSAFRENNFEGRNNGLYEQIILELYTSAGKYYEKVYINTADMAGWVSHDWMNPFLSISKID